MVVHTAQHEPVPERERGRGEKRSHLGMVLAGTSKALRIPFDHIQLGFELVSNDFGKVPGKSLEFVEIGTIQVRQEEHCRVGGRVWLVYYTAGRRGGEYPSLLLTDSRAEGAPQLIFVSNSFIGSHRC
jgi:hypothetical protein